ncbi:hypothetical protein M2R47_04440 [Moraxella sp. Tifton1]|uniref:hypothetical protein n=1 Tax=Moraxella oculi TaxID=2940516 RepID=UPI00201281FD|nr:hypothetical protein [Moraxella sp. Tifton1]MCL1623495.1 hypothetical protein [Moraxella sp. Tifton1]
MSKKRQSPSKATDGLRILPKKSIMNHQKSVAMSSNSECEEFHKNGIISQIDGN